MILERYKPQMCGAGTRCGTIGGCVAASELFTCVSAPPKCWNYFCGLAEGNLLRGVIVYTKDGRPGFLIFEGFGVKPGTMVTAINGVEPDESFFEKLAKETAPVALTMTIAGQSEPLQLIFSRP